MVSLDSWKLTAAMARSIANSLWHGDANPHRTNRRGVYYYDCAGHGGYVIDPQALKAHERRVLEELLPKVGISLCIQDIDGTPMVIAQRSEFSNRGARYNPALGKPYWVEREVLVAEEDCDWIYVEMLGITTTDHSVYPDESPERREFLLMKDALRMIRSSIAWRQRK
jgi:hypothetical protein